MRSNRKESSTSRSSRSCSGRSQYVTLRTNKSFCWSLFRSYTYVDSCEEEVLDRFLMIDERNFISLYICACRCRCVLLSGGERSVFIIKKKNRGLTRARTSSMIPGLGGLCPRIAQEPSLKDYAKCQDLGINSPSLFSGSPASLHDRFRTITNLVGSNCRHIHPNRERVILEIRVCSLSL